VTAVAGSTCDLDQITRGLYSDGIVALRGAFPREWVAGVREDIEAAFDEAVPRPGGAVGRGPKRYYVEVPPSSSAGSWTS
jgi:hypothetical protein